MPALGLGTWRMGEVTGARKAEVATLREGLDRGIGLIDTAEMYGEGGAEEIVAEATAGRRDDVFIVSKVYPHNASHAGTIAACERSLKRLRTDRIDLYLLHWRGEFPLRETVGAFEVLMSTGKIRRWGVSNFDVGDMTELAAAASAVGGAGVCAANQVLYHLGERGIEWKLLPDAAAAGMPIMAYSPLGQGAILADKVLGTIARRHGATPAAVAVAWTMRCPHVVSIPKTARRERVAEFVQGAGLELGSDDLKELEKVFPAPGVARPLAML